MDLFSQSKLTRSEWESVEKPIKDNEKHILNIIIKGYHNINVVENLTKTMTSFIKISPTDEMNLYLYDKYFKPTIESSIKYAPDYIPFQKFQIDSKTIRKLKSADLIRIQNVDETINTNKQFIFEHSCLHLCKNIIKNIKKNIPYLQEIYTLIHWNSLTIPTFNPHVKQFVQLSIHYAKLKTPLSNILYNSPDIIEKNTVLYDYEDIKLYPHQKDLFLFCKSNYDRPKLILYTAPTGTGKTLSPIGLSQGYKIIFVCVARHIGLALAKAAISMNKRIAFALGCESSSDIRLHYFSAVDYEINKRSGGIWKVDNSNGSKVEIMICDVQSYLSAMYYMISFNKPQDIITYWDEPTITMDYDNHPLHSKIHENWEKNKIPNVILSCATLPSQELIQPCLQDFCAYFDNAVVQTIHSFDCKKSIPIITTNGYCFAPHLDVDPNDIRKYVKYCQHNKTVLRYFDLEEIVRFIKWIHNTNCIPERMSIEDTFENIEEINMHAIKIYYLDILSRINTNDLHMCQLTLEPTRISKFETTTLTRTQSLPSYSNKIPTSVFTRNFSQNDTSTNDNKLNAALKGILLTTKDSHTLTDGPTIYLADNVLNLAKFYVQQSKIPDIILSNLLEIIQKNDILQEKISQLEEDIETVSQVKDNSDQSGPSSQRKDKKNNIRQKQGDENTQVLKDNVNHLRSQLRPVSLQSIYIPNSQEHQKKWFPTLSKYAFASDINEHIVKRIMDLNINTAYKLLVLMGIGVLIKQESKEYEEIVKQLADEQKLFLILTSSDFIYGTNYQFCHGFIGKDLHNMTQQKCLQAMGRVGRNKLQQQYSIRFRDDNMIKKLFQYDEHNTEAINMVKLFVHDD